MNDAAICKASPKVGATNWKRVRARTDAAVRRALVADSEVTPTDEAFWADAKLAMPTNKTGRPTSPCRRIDGPHPPP
jgi:hypothetical protein